MQGVIVFALLFALLGAATVAAPGVMILALGFGLAFFIVAGVLQGFGAFKEALDNPDDVHNVPITGGVIAARDRHLKYKWDERYGKFDPDWQRELERAAKETERTLKRELGDEAAERLDYWAAVDALRQVRSARREQSRYLQEQAYRNLRLAIGRNHYLARRAGFTGKVPPRVYPDPSEDDDPKYAAFRGFLLLAVVMFILACIVLAVAATGVAG